MAEFDIQLALALSVSMETPKETDEDATAAEAGGSPGRLELELSRAFRVRGFRVARRAPLRRASETDHVPADGPMCARIVDKGDPWAGVVRVEHNVHFGVAIPHADMRNPMPPWAPRRWLENGKKKQAGASVAGAPKKRRRGAEGTEAVHAAPTWAELDIRDMAPNAETLPRGALQVVVVDPWAPADQQPDAKSDAATGKKGKGGQKKKARVVPADSDAGKHGPVAAAGPGDAGGAAPAPPTSPAMRLSGKADESGAPSPWGRHLRYPGRVLRLSLKPSTFPPLTQPYPFCAPAPFWMEPHVLRTSDFVDADALDIFWAGEAVQWGVRPRRQLPAGTWVTTYRGEVIGETEMKRRIRSEDLDGYIAQLDLELYVDARVHGNLGRFINHGCVPNCEMVGATVDGVLEIAIRTTKVVDAGDELRSDYGWTSVSERMASIACCCGALSCTGKLIHRNTTERRQLFGGALF